MFGAGWGSTSGAAAGPPGLAGAAGDTPGSTAVTGRSGAGAWAPAWVRRNAPAATTASGNHAFTRMLRVKGTCPAVGAEDGMKTDDPYWLDRADVVIELPARLSV